MSSFVGQAIKRACEEVAKELLAEIKDMMMRACDERSPGVILNWFYLDSKHLKKLDEDPAMYSMADVEMKVKKKAFDHVLFSVRPENGQNSPVCDLYILTEEEVGDSHKKEISPRRSASKREEDFPSRNTDPPAERVAAPSLLRNNFPVDRESVSLNLISVRGSKWEEIGMFLIDSEDLKEIRNRMAETSYECSRFSKRGRWQNHLQLVSC
ncbi:uncharacterized protein [Oscarella lobularis]|uniref:uncharacterized protein n=1 Tax=Oscarella lobularis TaxID=121494 RepID=UPI00331449BA